MSPEPPSPGAWALGRAAVLALCLSSFPAGAAADVLIHDGGVNRDRAAAETVRVATKMGVSVEPINGIPAQAYLDAETGEGLEFVQSELDQAAIGRGEGLPSMLQDIRKGRRTEIEYLNGYVVAQANKFNVNTPINHALAQTVQKIEADKLTPAFSNLDILESYI